MTPKDTDIQLMAIVNLTDDSFFSGSRTVRDGLVDIGLVKARVAAALSEGAAIVDLGASSSRPGAVPVGEKVELDRLEPVLEILSKEFPDTCFSVDTTRAKVVESAFRYLGGRLLVNDISSGEDDPEMLPLVGKLGLRFVAMHGWDPMKFSEGDVVGRVAAYFREFARKADSFGIADWILDPGFGFSKTVEENWDLLHRLAELKSLGRPILVGISRKSMLYKPLGLGPEDVLEETCRANSIALEGGARILRIHDVEPAYKLLEQYES